MDCSGQWLSSLLLRYWFMSHHLPMPCTIPCHQSLYFLVCGCPLYIADPILQARQKPLAVMFVMGFAHFITAKYHLFWIYTQGVSHQNILVAFDDDFSAMMLLKKWMILQYPGLNNVYKLQLTFLLGSQVALISWQWLAYFWRACCETMKWFFALTFHKHLNPLHWHLSPQLHKLSIHTMCTNPFRWQMRQNSLCPHQLSCQLPAILLQWAPLFLRKSTSPLL